MRFTCPNCNWSHDFDEAMAGPRGTVIRCEGCKRFYRLFGVRRTDERVAPGWMVKRKNGKIVRIIRLSHLHSLILEGAVAEEDEFSKTGKTWKKISEVYELSGMFELARLDGRKQPRQGGQKAARAVKGAEDALHPFSRKPSAGPDIESVPAKGTRAADPDASGLLVFPILLKRSMRIDLDDSKVLPLPLKTVQETIEDIAIPIPLKRIRSLFGAGEDDALPIPLKKRRIVKDRKTSGARGKPGKK